MKKHWVIETSYSGTIYFFGTEKDAHLVFEKKIKSCKDLVNFRSADRYEINTKQFSISV